jgi:HEPN domain-containing protein
MGDINIKKTYTRKDGFSEIELLHSAVDHLASAKILFDTNARCFDSAGYLSHLGIELIFKALLLNKSDQFPPEHSLAKLSLLIRNQGVNLNYTQGHEQTLKIFR